MICNVKELKQLLCSSSFYWLYQREENSYIFATFENSTYFSHPCRYYRKGGGYMKDKLSVKNTLDQIPKVKPDARQIIGLVKENGRITGYQLSDHSIVEKQQAVNMAKLGQIAGVGIAHRGDTEYLKTIPDDSENNNLSNLPSVSPQS